MKIIKIIYIFITIVILFGVFASFTFAQEDMSLTPTPVDYQLPYPGLLPGNPLYFLKVFRDRVISFLISDPLKKGEFDLLQADKRISGGLYLFQQNPKNINIGPLVSKGENYFSESISQVDQATKQGEDTSMLLHKMLLSSEKHIEVIDEMEKTAKGDLLNSLSQEEKRVQGFEKMVYDTINKK